MRKATYILLLPFFLWGTQATIEGKVVPSTPNSYLDGSVIHLPCGIDLDTRASEPSKHSTMLSSNQEGVGSYLVHFEGPIASNERETLEASGALIVGYLPNYTYLVRMDQATLACVRDISDIDWMGDYQPNYKISPDIDMQAQMPEYMTIVLYPGSPIGQLANIISDMGGSVVDSADDVHSPVLRVMLSPAKITTLALEPYVKWIEPYQRPYALNAYAQWVLQTWETNNRRIWDQGLTGEGQIVSSIDSGLRTTHNFFRDPSVSITDFGDYPSHRKVIGYKKAAIDPDGYILFGDQGGHGSHTSTSIAGNDEPVGGTSEYDGIAPDAKIYYVDAGGGGSGMYLPANIEYSLSIPYDGNSAGGARLISLSWGSQNTRSYDSQCMQMDRTMWRRPDYLIITSGGNTSYGTYTGTPANAKNLIAVGGCQNGGAAFLTWSGSSIGPAGDGRIKPDIVAPGQDVHSAYISSDNAEITWSGTSMASPLATGSATLIRQYFTDGYYPAGTPSGYLAGFNPSAALLKAMLVNSTETDYGSNYVPSVNVGWGRPNLDNVLYFPGDTRKLLISDFEEGLETGSQFLGKVRVKGESEDLRITLNWTDYPGEEGASPALVNDLNLEVFSPSGLVFRGNNFDHNYSVQDGDFDQLNTTENVFLSGPETGEWEIHVHGNNVPMGPQPFALVVTGDIDADLSSIVVNDISIDDAGQTYPDGNLNPGEAVTIYVILLNSLDQTLNNVTATISSSSPNVTVTEGSSTYGNIGASQTAEGDGFGVSVSSSAHQDASVKFEIDISSNEFSATSTFELVIGTPRYEWTTHDVGDVKLTVGEQGAIGFYGNTPNDVGHGFRYPRNSSDSWLYHASFAAGNSANYVNDRFYGDNANNRNAKDWEVTTNPDGKVIIGRYDFSDQDSWACFDDAGNWATGTGLTVYQYGYAWKNKDYVILKYVLNNPSTQTLSNMYSGIIADFDMGYDAQVNKAGTVSELNLAYTKQSETDYPHVGVMLLKGTKANISILANPEFIYDTAATDDSHIWNEDTLFRFLSGQLSFASDPTETDWSVVVSAGPFDLSSEGTDTVAFAFVAGDDLEDLKANAQDCKNKWESMGGLEETLARPDFGLNLSPELLFGKGTIRFSIPKKSDVRLDVFDLAGRKVATLFEGNLTAGEHEIFWDGQDQQGNKVSKGVYFVTLTANRAKAVHKTVMVR
ncbi:S8 family serine peptidase [candidate division WOR-3 bacterium]|nr:S8 family serine peptidase [candidate division WOR-3 bacterium]